MKKIILLSMLVMLYCMASAQKQKTEIDTWVKQQTENFDSYDIVDYVTKSISEEYIVYSDNFDFNTFETSYCSTVVIDSSHFIIAYQDWGNMGYGTAIIGTIIGYDIIYGDEFVFNTGVTNHISTCALTKSSFAIAYNDIGNLNSETVILASISADYQITFGSEYSYRENGEYSISMVSLDSTHFVVAYHSSSLYLGAILGTVSNNSITYSAEFVSAYNINPLGGLSAFSLGSSHFGIAFSGTSNGNIVIGATDSNTISYTSNSIFNQGNTQHISAASFDSNSFVVIFRDISNLNFGTSILGTFTGNDVSFGDEYVFNNSEGTIFTSVACMDSSKFVVVYSEYENFILNGISVVGCISNDSIEYGYNAVYKSGLTQYNSVAALNSHKFILAYEDDGNSYFGTSLIGKITESTVLSIIIDSIASCGKSIAIPIQISNFEDIRLFALYLDYDTATMTSIGYQNENSNLDGGILSVTDEQGEISITWYSNEVINIVYDTLLYLLFDPVIVHNTMYGYANWDIEDSFFRNSTGEELESNYYDGVITITPMLEEPQGPSEIFLDFSINTDYKINKIADNTNYQWYLYPAEAGTIITDDTIGTVIWNRNFDGLLANIYVVASNTICEEIISDTLEIIINPAGITASTTNKLNYNLTPNPSSGIVYLYAKNSTDNISMSIYNSTGQIMHKEEIQYTTRNFEHKIDLSHCDSGMYLIKLVSNNNVTIRKVLIR